MITTIEVTSENDAEHDGAVVEDPAFIQWHLDVAQAMSTYVAAKLGVPTPKISGTIIGIRHERD